MFRLQNRLGDYSASIFGKDVYLKTRDKNILEIEFHESGIFKWKQLVEVESEYHSIGIWQDGTRCFFGYSRKIEIRKKENGELIFVFDIDGISHFKGQYFISTKKKEGKKRDVSLYKIEETVQLISALSNVRKAKYFNILDKLFLSSKTSIESLNDSKWQHNFADLIQSENATLRGEILEKEDKLFFVVSGTLFCLDVNQGKILHQFKGIGRPIFKDQDHIYSTKRENILCKIHPETYEVEEWDVDELIKENGFEAIHDHRCAVQNGLFYFTQTLGDTKAKLGILDTNKKELVYKHDFLPENGGVGSIQVNNNRIFVHMQDKTLHIFEREVDM